VTRWPVHPQPLSGESMSSWLSRTSSHYGLSVTALINDGHSWAMHPKELDLNPSTEFIQWISEKTGVGQSNLRAMTWAGLCGGVAQKRLKSILLPPTLPTVEPPLGTFLWAPSHGSLNRACPDCLRLRPSVIKTIWTLPLTVTCPEHGCYLEHVSGGRPWYRPERMSVSKRREADHVLLKNDARSESSVKIGKVRLRAQAVSKENWLGMLHCISDELVSHALLGQLPSYTKEALGLTNLVRSEFHKRKVFRYFEQATLPAQLQVVEATARTIAAIESGRLRPRGDSPLVLALLPLQPHAEAPTLHLTQHEAFLAARDGLLGRRPGHETQFSEDDFYKLMSKVINSRPEHRW